MDKFIILLANISRTSAFSFFGYSGKAYRFIWSDAHKAMVFEGKTLEPEEFDRVTPDIFAATAEQNLASPVPRRIAGDGATSGESTVFTVPKFGHTELMRICEHIGALEQELGEKNREIALFRGSANDRDLLTIAQQIVAKELGAQAQPQPVMAGTHDGADYDPDDGIPATPGAIAAKPIAAPAISAPIAPPPPMVPKTNPAPSMGPGAYFDPDDI